MIGLVKRNCILMDSRTFIMLYKALVRPHVQYANSIWSPYNKKEIQRLLKSSKKSNKISNITQKVTIQRTFITIKFTYFKIQTITRRMIKVYKIIHDIGLYDRSVALEFQNYLVVVMYLVPEVININCKTTAFITTFENFLLLHEQLTCGTVYRIVYSRCQFSLNNLKQDQTNFGEIRMLCLTALLK